MWRSELTEAAKCWSFRHAWSKAGPTSEGQIVSCVPNRSSIAPQKPNMTAEVEVGRDERNIHPRTLASATSPRDRTAVDRGRRGCSPRQPEGRRRQDDDRHQSRHRARRHRRGCPDHRSRSAGQCLDRPRHRPAQPPLLDLRRARRRNSLARRDRRDRGAAASSCAFDARSLRPRAGNRPGARPRLSSAQRARAAQDAGTGPDKLHLCAGRLPAFAQPSDGQRDGGGACDPGAAAMRVLCARRPVATSQDRRARCASSSIRISRSTASC